MILGATPEPTTPGATQGQTLPEFSPIVVNIAYSLRNPVDGVEFVLPNDTHPYVSSSFILQDPRLTPVSEGSSCLHHSIMSRCSKMLGALY